jgi:hypothetical protein
MATALLAGWVLNASADPEVLQPVDLFSLSPIVPAADNNPWPTDWEEAFRRRGRDYVARNEHRAPEARWVYEKSGGGFMAFAKGRRESALAAMQIQPPDVEHTAGVDFYWCFHLEKQPRYYFQFGTFLPSDFVARMKEGARIWTAEDPRPNLELVLQLNCPDVDVAAHARRQLVAMWRTRGQVREMAAQARAECRNGEPASKIVFAEYLESILTRWPGERPETMADWTVWWKLIADGDWKIYEEYERRTNPRPHPRYGIGSGPVGTSWDPAVRGGWVDWRNTDNLRGMREVAVYLFAEETGNELVRKVYRERVRRTACGFLGVGNGEWDSPAYLGLTVQAYLMLFDFARDREVRLLAKGILDYLSTAAALKYFHGGAVGPNTRDYGTWASGNGGSASRLWSTWLPEPRSPVTIFTDKLFLSAYRPPAAVVALADRQHGLPCEILATHPVYNNWVPGGSAGPAYHETLYRSRGFQMGSQVEGGTADGNGGKIVLAHPQRGFDYVIVTTQTQGNPCVGGNDRIAQCRNAMLWLSAGRPGRDGAAQATAWRILIPPDTVVERTNSVVFLRFAQAWAAVHPVGCAFGDVDDKGIRAYKGKGRRDDDADPAPDATDPRILPATGQDRLLTGFAVEMGDELHFADYATFKATVADRSRAVDAGGQVSFVAASGAQVGMAWDGTSALPVVERDGRSHDWEQHRALWQAGSTGGSPVSLGWKQGRLRVESGGYRFEGVLDMASGRYAFTNGTTMSKP